MSGYGPSVLTNLRVLLLHTHALGEDDARPPGGRRARRLLPLRQEAVQGHRSLRGYLSTPDASRQKSACLRNSSRQDLLTPTAHCAGGMETENVHEVPADSTTRSTRGRTTGRRPARLAEIIAAHKTSPGSDLLDVACGTGGHFPHLRETFTIEGLDLDPDMLAIARAKHPDIPLHQGDMLDFDLGRQFDVVVSLFSSIGYARTPERMALAVRNMARHVRPGGVLLIEPFFSPQSWKPREKAPGANVVDRPEITVVRMVDWVRKATPSTSTFHYLVGTPSGVEHFTEVHEMGLFTHEEHCAAFTAAGMAVTFDEAGLMGRGLYIGTPAPSPR